MIFTFLFMPYGYKFERTIDGRFYERYSGTNLKWPNREPWYINASGLIRVSDGRILYVNGDGRQWSNTANTDLYSAYHLYDHGGELHPSLSALRADAYSVRQQYTKFYLLFTPYGYKFEYGVSWSDRLIREEYRSTGVEQSWRNPWKINRNGYVNSSGGSLQRIMNGGWHWCSTSVAFSSSDSIWIDSEDLYPAVDGNRSFGFSVSQ